MDRGEVLVESCEHCGPMEDFQPHIYDGNTVWCVYCAIAGDMITEEFFEKMKKDTATTTTKCEKCGRVITGPEVKICPVTFLVVCSGCLQEEIL